SAENACRLAAICHVWRHGPQGTVGADDMDRGVHIARWLLSEARRILTTTAGNVAAEDAELLARWIRSCEDPPTLKDMAQRSPRRLRDNQGRRGAALALLSAKGWIRQSTQDGKTVLILNPNLSWENQGMQPLPRLRRPAQVAKVAAGSQDRLPGKPQQTRRLQAQVAEVASFGEAARGGRDANSQLPGPPRLSLSAQAAE
ncbi:MAG: DUF3987 domain-containing protein, partial [Geminicoccaceae bacterium]